MANLNYDPRPPERRVAETADGPATNERYGWLAFAGAGLVAIGSLLPWVEAHTAFGTISINGTEGDGQFTLIGAAIFALIWFAADKTSGWMAVAVGLAIAGTLFSIVKINDVQDAVAAAESEYLTASVGAGLWLCLIGSVAALIGCIRKTRR
jgi:predicted small integral membrane protein